MQITRKCEICGNEFTTNRTNTVCCSKECQIRSNRKMNGESCLKYVKKKREQYKGKSITEIAVEASKEGLTYGQKQAQEYAEQVIVGHAPKGYTRIGDRMKD